ncbi:MAG: DMT family transporter, partial [Marinibacterium sp.]|nr:DMT family transporter [Marinibacterium sp.]
MTERRDMDLTGTLALTGFGILLAFNQVVMKVTGEGFSPVFQAGLRSAGATVLVAGWILLQGRDLRVSPHVVPSGLLLGALFGLEFLFLFNGIDLTTVSRASIMLYSMPVWLALAAHFVLPGERLTPPRAAGLVMAMAGVVLALFDPATGQEGNLIGDLLALAAALCWAGIALCVRLTPVAQARPEMQL